MNVKVKTALVIIITLAIGIVIGAMLNRAVLEKRIKRAFSWREPNMFVETLLDNISPTAEQRDRIEDILKAYAKSVSEIRTKSREEMEAAFESLRTELEPLLTEEQLDRLGERIPERPASPFFMNPLNPRRPNQDIERLKVDLNLSEDQFTRIKASLEQLMDEFRKAPRPEGKPEEMMRFMREMRTKQDEAIREVLTPKQKEIFNKMKRGFRMGRGRRRN